MSGIPNDAAAPIMPDASLGWLQASGCDLDQLAHAVLCDALAMVPVVSIARIRFMAEGRRYFHEHARDGDASSDLERDASVIMPIRCAGADAGSIELVLHAGACLAPEAGRYALGWLAAIASAAIERQGCEAERRRRALAERRFDATFSRAPIGIAHVAIDGGFLMVNDQFSTITGHSRHELMVHGFQQITHPDDLESDLVHVNRLLDGRADRYMMEKRYIRPDGGIVWVNLTVALIRTVSGDPDFFLSVIEDLSEVKRAHAAATRDPLTGLLNRRGLMERLGRKLQRAARAERPLTLIFLDLDNFKQVNDRFGHAQGDACLSQVAELLQQAIRPDDEIARIGGDEFIILLADQDGQERTEAMEAVLLDRLETVLIEGAQNLPWPVTGSFGAVTARPGDNMSAEELIASADSAMFAAKRRRRSRRGWRLAR